MSTRNSNSILESTASHQDDDSRLDSDGLSQVGRPAACACAAPRPRRTRRGVPLRFGCPRPIIFGVVSKFVLFAGNEPRLVKEHHEFARGLPKLNPSTKIILAVTELYCFAEPPLPSLQKSPNGAETKVNSVISLTRASTISSLAESLLLPSFVRLLEAEGLSGKGPMFSLPLLCLRRQLVSHRRFS